MSFQIHSNRMQRGFTLVEILVVMVILSIMGGMVLSAVQGVTTTAKAARTRNIIATVDSVIQEQYESYKYRPYSVEPPNLTQLAPDGVNTFGYELLSTEAARVRMLMIRDLQRMELPDRLSDIADAPTLLNVAANPVVRDTGTGAIIGTRDDRTQRASFEGTWYDKLATFLIGGHNIPAKLASYRDRIPKLMSDGTTSFSMASTAQEAENQGAECLYMIMAMSFVGGQPAISSIPSSNIGDTDGDNLLEILDGWGQPLGFIRWPVGYNDPQQSIDPTKPDEFDPFRSDFAYVSTDPVAKALVTTVDPNFRLTPWSMRPLIISAGEDGQFGIALNPRTIDDDETTEVINYSYRANANWMIDSAHMGDEYEGRSGTYQMIDPFLRNFIAANLVSGTFSGLLIGADIPGSDAESERADNISSYSLQSGQ